MKLRFNIMSQFLVGSGLLILCVISLAFVQKQAGDIQGQLRDWQSLSAKLEYDILNLQKQAQHYKLNAPRDFESYNRDLAVFYKQFQQQIATIEANHQKLNPPLALLQSNQYLNQFFSSNSDIHIALNEYESWQKFWDTFKIHLDEALGDPSEPRLEWGADHIISTSENIISRLEMLKHLVGKANTWFVDTYRTINVTILAGLLLILISTLTMFALFIVRPIVATTAVCKAVASGDYGKKVKVNGTAEAKELQKAFNDLSSRSKLLMDMLNDVNKPGDVFSKLQSIYNSGKPALGCSWIGLMSFDEQKASLLASAPSSLNTNFKYRQVSLSNPFGKELYEALEKHWFELTSLRQMSVRRADERFLRDLHKHTMAQNIVGYSFKCPKHNDFLLMFACNLEEGFSEQQKDLIKALSKLMADGIIAGLDFKTVKVA